jgi:hypothetical protein
MGIALWWASRIDRSKVAPSLKELGKKPDRKIRLWPWLYSATTIGLPVFLVGFVGLLDAWMPRDPTSATNYWYIWFVMMILGLALILAVGLKALKY